MIDLMIMYDFGDVYMCILLMIMVDEIGDKY